MSEAWIGAIAAIGGAIVGATVSIVHLAFSHRREQRKQDDSLLTTALTFLTGGENERSCGISMIEGVFADKKEYARLLVPALTSQAVYLLLHTNAQTSRTEFYNWLRLMELIDELCGKFDMIGDYYAEIGNAFLIKSEPGHSGGIDMPSATLEIWAKKYGIDLGA